MLLWLKEKHQILCPTNFSWSSSFQNVAVGHTRLNILMYATIPPPLLPSKSFKNDQDFHQNWTVTFCCPVSAYAILFKTVSNYTPFWIPSFWSWLATIRILHISIGNTHILTSSWFLDFFQISLLLYFLWKYSHSDAVIIHWFYLNFIFVTRPC